MKLDTPLDVAKITLRNRIGFAPVNLGSASMSDQRRRVVVDICDTLASSGLGLVYVGGIAVSPTGRSNRSSMVMTDPRTQEFVARIAANNRSHGAATAVQIMHSGRQASSAETGGPLVAPSATPCPYYGEVPRAASRRDIRAIVREFGEAAALAAAAGADLIEIHAAHGYLLSGFLSPATNTRSDSYGGTTAKRFRLLNEVVESVRARVDVAVGVRVNVSERHTAGLCLEELVEGLAGLTSRLDFLSVSAGMYAAAGEPDDIIPAHARGPALWASQSAEMRRALAVPTFVAGNIFTAEVASEVVGSEQADVALMARALLAEPELYAKSVASQHRRIQPCTELYLCKYHSLGAEHVYCPHNEWMGPDLRPSIDSTLARRKTTDR